jgi:hypothetical protein
MLWFELEQMCLYLILTKCMGLEGCYQEIDAGGNYSTEV